jgi:hypothetical protein
MRLTLGSIVVLLLLASAYAAPRVSRAPRPYDVFRAARAECKNHGPRSRLAALVATAWQPERARALVTAGTPTAEQLAELDRLAEETLGAEERTRVAQSICSDRVVRRAWLEDDDDRPTRTRYEIETENDACVRVHDGEPGCWCGHRLVFELRDSAWVYAGDRRLCGVVIADRDRLVLSRAATIDTVLATLKARAAN